MVDSEEEEQNFKTNGEVDMEEEIKCALSKISKIGKKNLKQKEHLQKYEEEDHDSRAKMSQSLEKTKSIIMNIEFQ